MQIRVNKVREDAKLPVRAHADDAGMDLFYCPGKETAKVIMPGDSVILETGLRIEVPEGHMLEVKNKGGIAAKKSLIVGSCVVDRGYDGEVFVNLHNVGRSNQEIRTGDKIAQAVFVKIETNIDIIVSDSIYDEKTERGDGKLGSTGEQ